MVWGGKEEEIHKDKDLGQSRTIERIFCLEKYCRGQTERDTLAGAMGSIGWKDAQKTGEMGKEGQTKTLRQRKERKGKEGRKEDNGHGEIYFS